MNQTRVSKGFYFALSLVLVSAIGLSDFLTKERISFYVFYSLPIFLTAWYAGRWPGVSVCLFASITWFLVDFSDYPNAETLTYLDAVVRFLFFAGISLVLTALREALDREKRFASTDFLTGLPNRRTLIQTAGQEIDRAQRYGHALTIAYIDLDDFKPVNDRFGHQTGDQLLRGIARALRESIRASDILSRIGGDEFVVLFPETDSEAARSALEKLKISLRESTEAKAYGVTFSVGAVTYLDPSVSADEMIKKADSIMYYAKSLGKDTIRHEEIATTSKVS